MIQLEKGVARPTNYGVGRGHKKYPWEIMEIGDSFFVAGRSRTLQSQASNAGFRYGRKFTAYRVDGGVRVWRDQ